MAMPGTSQLVDNALGSLMIAGSAAKGTPQIARIVRKESTRGLSPASIYGDCLIYSTKVAYHVRRGYPISAWGELLILMLQNIICIGLLHRYPDETRGGVAAQGHARRRWAGPLRDASLLVPLWLALAALPESLLPFLSALTAPLLFFSYGAQIVTNFKRKSTGQLAPLTVLMRWAGSLLRVSTTLSQLQGDPAVLVNHALGVLGCTIVLAQICFYGGANADAATVAASAGRQTTSGVLSAALMWRSLGGFGDGDDDTRDLDDKALRANFDAIDTDGSGAISAAELQQAINASSANASLDPDSVRSMMDAADTDGDGMIDFGEYRRVIRGEDADGPKEASNRPSGGDA